MVKQEYGSKNSPTDSSNLDHVTKVIAYHPRYLDHFLNTQKFVMQCDGPLPYDYRNYIAIMAAARHKCTYLVNLYEEIFLANGGDPNWLNGLEHIPPKLRAISDINKILAHRPWLLNKEHVERLTKGQNSWSLSEVVHAIVLLAHYHSLSSFVFSCGLTQELDGASHKIENNNVLTQKTAFNRLNDLYNSQHPENLPNGDDANIRPEVTVDALMQRMKRLSEKNDECSETELSNRFKHVEQQAAELPPVVREAPADVPQQLGRYVDDPGFTYQDFARRGAENIPQTFRIQDYSWDDHGYSLVNRLYNDVGFYLDDKFRAAYNLTYYTIAGRTNVDTSKFRRAIWNYIQCIYGIRHDDYDYGEVNQLLDRSLKMFIKTACCFPERITKLDYDSVLVELQHSEKVVHINLMILEARNQAELLYALREQQSKSFQKRDIEQLLKAALGCADSTQKYTPSSDTSSFLHSDDSNDSSRLLIASESDHSDTQSNHSEQSESSGTTFTSTTSTLNDSRSVTVMKKLHPSRPLSRWHSLVAANNEEIPIVYHKSMARQFPVKDRTPEQMEMRRRNTEAARVSRAKSKMAEVMMEKEASELVFCFLICSQQQQQQQNENETTEQSQELAEQSNAPESIDPECLIKHPLQHTWTLWYLEVDRTKKWTDSMNEVTSFSTVEDFWSLFNHIRGPSEIKVGGDYMLFKSHIRPMWEDDANKHGGRWTISMNKRLSDKCWLDTVLCLIGETFEHSDQICGATVNVRQKIDKISIWTADYDNRAAVLDIGRTYKERLGLRENIYYQMHKDTMVKLSSSGTKSTYTV
uniref:eIF-4F 25 kDa subunit n=1 Tax=Anopheles quadriannulatus TaxID=34691 RepID=A0A182WX33_ANOQN